MVLARDVLTMLVSKISSSFSQTSSEDVTLSLLILSTNPLQVLSVDKAGLFPASEYIWQAFKAVDASSPNASVM